MSACGIGVNLMQCEIVISNFEPQSSKFFHFRVNNIREMKEHFYLPQTVGYIAPLLSSRDGYDIK